MIIGLYKSRKIPKLILNGKKKRMFSWLCIPILIIYYYYYANITKYKYCTLGRQVIWHVNYSHVSHIHNGLFEAFIYGGKICLGSCKPRVEKSDEGFRKHIFPLNCSWILFIGHNINNITFERQKHIIQPMRYDFKIGFTAIYYESSHFPENESYIYIYMASTRINSPGPFTRG